MKGNFRQEDLTTLILFHYREIKNKKGNRFEIRPKRPLWSGASGAIGGHMLSRRRVFLVCLQQAQKKPPSMRSNTSTPIGKLWVEIYSKALETDAGVLLLRPENTVICLKAKHGPASGAPRAGMHLPTSVHSNDCRVCSEEELSAGVGLRSPSPAFKTR